MTLTLDIDHVSALIRETAEAEILPRYQRLEAVDIRQKSGPQDLVTAADLASEARLERALRAHLPGSAVVGEEGAFADPTLLERLRGAGAVWIIDPVDGTINFCEGRPHFVVIVALVRDGVIVAGWLHDVLAGETAVAARGAGAWIGGRRLSVGRALLSAQRRCRVSRARARHQPLRAVHAPDALGPRRRLPHSC